MPPRDNELWQRCWLERETAFHQTSTNTQLMCFWPSLGLDAASRVFVPLCGKSLDMLWLAAQGHVVLGVELSPIATRAFFRENGLKPKRRQWGPFTFWQSGAIGILCGDFFSLTANHLGAIAGVYDRASLTALNADMRARYVRHLHTILPADGKILLLTTEEAEAGGAEYQVDGPDEEVVALYGADFHVQLRHVDSVLENDTDPANEALLRVQKKVYVLTPHGAGVSGACA